MLQNYFLFPLLFTTLFARLDCCLYSKYLEFNKKINGNDFIVMTLKNERKIEHHIKDGKKAKTP